MPENGLALPRAAGLLLRACSSHTRTRAYTHTLSPLEQHVGAEPPVRLGR